MSKTLLPTGCYDLLPPYARQESSISSKLLDIFESFGYEQVSPPMLEYSESLLSGRGAALSSKIFRIMDPGAHKVMALRADITPQIARIATSRMAKAPRPLRMSYNGLILRMQSEQFKSDRQLRQTGIELLGTSTADADAEVILIAIESLQAIGVSNISIDLNLPGVVNALLAEEQIDDETKQRLLSAISYKDISTVRGFKCKYSEALTSLMQCAGNADKALETMESLDLPDTALQQINELKQVICILKSANNQDCTLTIDATETNGLDYHCGISFSIFVAGISSEIGRGGRYRINNKANSEEATGFTLYIETLRKLIADPVAKKRILVADNICPELAKKLQKDNFITIFSLSEYDSNEDEAKRLNCQYIYENDAIKPL